MSPIEECSMLVTRVLAPNPTPMTGDGTNSYVIRHPSSYGVVLVDPGPADPSHLARLERFGRVELILLTHRHRDHAEGVARLRAATRAPVRAIDRALCGDADPLHDGERIRAGGTEIVVLATPGHTDDSACFVLRDDRTDDHGVSRSVLTGDTVLGRGTTLVGAFDGSLSSYLTALEQLRDVGHVPAFPGHGEPIRDLSAVCGIYLDHRQRRLTETSAALRALALDAATDDETVHRVVDHMYGDLHPLRRRAAIVTTRANLAHTLTMASPTPEREGILQ